MNHRRLLITALLLCTAFGAFAEIIKPVLKNATTDTALDISALPWNPWEEGFTSGPEGTIICDNGDDSQIRRGAGKTVELNQSAPAPIVVKAKSRASKVSGSPDKNYSLYLDIIYNDGTPLWGRTAPFQTGTHDWEEHRSSSSRTSQSKASTAGCSCAPIAAKPNSKTGFTSSMCLMEAQSLTASPLPAQKLPRLYPPRCRRQFRFSLL